MKKSVVLFALALLLGACQNTSKTSVTENAGNETSNAETKKTTLVAYFSASEAHVTAQVAKTLAEATDADLFEIVPEQVYTAEDLDWRNEQSRSTIEMKDSTARPAVARKVENMDQYTTIYVGFPSGGTPLRASSTPSWSSMTSRARPSSRLPLRAAATWARVVRT